jgi:hypothetical protein
MNFKGSEKNTVKFVVSFAYAVIQPFAVVVEVKYTSIAFSAVFGVLIYMVFANFTDLWVLFVVYWLAN